MNRLEATQKGFRVLAGPFDLECQEDARLSHQIKNFIESTRGRVVAVSENSASSFYLWRPSLEMETLKQTESRLRLAKLRR